MYIYITCSIYNAVCCALRKREAAKSTDENCRLPIADCAKASGSLTGRRAIASISICLSMCTTMCVCECVYVAIANGNLAGVQLLLTSNVYVCLVSSCSRLTECKQQLNSSTRTPSAPIVPHNGHTHTHPYTHTRTASSRTTCAARLSLSPLVAIAIYARAADLPISIVQLPLSCLPLSLSHSLSLSLYISSSCSCSCVQLCCIRKNCLRN